MAWCCRGFVDQALAGGPLVVHDDGRQVRCFAHVADVVDAILQPDGLPGGLRRVFNLGSDMPVTIRAWPRRSFAWSIPRDDRTRLV